MRIFTQKTLPIIVALFVLFASSIYLKASNTVGYYTITDSPATNTLDTVTFDYPAVAGMIIILVALVSVVAYGAHHPKQPLKMPPARAKSRARKRR
jgi:hypothetical protein